MLIVREKNANSHTIDCSLEQYSCLWFEISFYLTRRIGEHRRGRCCVMRLVYTRGVQRTPVENLASFHKTRSGNKYVIYHVAPRFTALASVGPSAR